MKRVVIPTVLAASAWATSFEVFGQLSLSSGLEYVTGDYGKASSTEEWKIPLAASYRSGPWSFRLSMPLSRVEGVANVLEQEARDSSDVGFVGDDDDDNGAGAGTGAGASGANAIQRTQSGIGDATLSASYLLIEPNSAPAGIDVGGRLKLPVAGDSKCYLTNGELDFSVQANAYQTFGKLDPFVSLGWTKRGDPQRRDSNCNVATGTRVDLRNPFFLGLGLGVRFSDVTSLRAEYEYREKLRDTSDPRSELKFLIQQRITQNARAGAYVIVGFSDNSPDWGLGVTASYRF
ncbi:MAG: hypothetical protein ACKVQA_24070 [Burkholderiales bacterium]